MLANRDTGVNFQTLGKIFLNLTLIKQIIRGLGRPKSIVCKSDVTS